MAKKYKDVNQAKELLSTNRLKDTARFIVYMYNEIDRTENVSRSKINTYEKAKERFIEEWALVTGSTLDKARNKIELALK